MRKNRIEAETIVGFEGNRAIYVHNLGGIKRICCEGADNYTGDFRVDTVSGDVFRLCGKPAFVFLTGLTFPIGDLPDAIGASEGARVYVDDPEAIAPIIRMIIHAEEYVDRLGNGRERVDVDLQRFPTRRAALDYLRKAQVHALGDTWEGFDLDDRHYPDSEWIERLRKMGL